VVVGAGTVEEAGMVVAVATVVSDVGTVVALVVGEVDVGPSMADEVPAPRMLMWCCEAAVPAVATKKHCWAPQLKVVEPVLMLRRATTRVVGRWWVDPV